jgi:hypothetical protein
MQNRTQATIEFSPERTMHKVCWLDKRAPGERVSLLARAIAEQIQAQTKWPAEAMPEKWLSPNDPRRAYDLILRTDDGFLYVASMHTNLRWLSERINIDVLTENQKLLEVIDYVWWQVPRQLRGKKQGFLEFLGQYACLQEQQVEKLVECMFRPGTIGLYWKT